MFDWETVFLYEMDATYITYDFKVKPLEVGREILVAQLGLAGFESFVEHEEGFIAYIQEGDWHANILNDVQLLENDDFDVSFEKKQIAQTNWNEAWEKNFDPIVVDDEAYIRAPFHEPKSFPFDIIIEPKMSFGTGHHETTHMMVQHLLKLDLKGKKVLDMGCGTGVLAILAAMKGAAHVDAIDIDNWCYQNSIENTERNGCSVIDVYEGDATLLAGKQYDVIIANINRNILLDDMKYYAACFEASGILLLSGFYKEDIQTIDANAASLGLQRAGQLERNNWVALKYLK